MRARQAARKTSHFIKPSGLGKADPGPVIEEVAIQRGNIRPKIIVKDGMISQSNFNYRVGEQVTVHAKLSGRGYFYGTFQYQQNQFLAFVTPVTRSLSYSFILEKPLNNLNFHIGHTIPTDLNPTYLDVKSRQLLRNNPNTYNSLGFIPDEPAVKDSVNGKEWGGKLSEHSYTRHGINTVNKTKGHNVRYSQNLDGGWIGASAVYVYDGKSWVTPGSIGTLTLQVGQPHCIVTKLAGYKNTPGVGGSYQPYADYPGSLPPAWNITLRAQAKRKAAEAFFWSSADKIRGDRICLMESNYVNSAQYSRDDHKGHGEENYLVGAGAQLSDGIDTGMFPGGLWFPTTNGDSYHPSNDYCAKVEWWNPETGEWSSPAIHPPWEAKITQDGKFAFYFRFPRQLIESDEFYYKTPQWQITKTYDCYPMAGNNNELQHWRIGRPYHQLKTEKTSLTLEFEGKTLYAHPESPRYTVMVAPEAKSDRGTKSLDRDRQKKDYIPTMADGTSLVTMQAADPISFSYADNPDILKAYWTNGNFTPGGSFMLLGQAMDFFGHFWVSTQPLRTKNSGPFDLMEQQRDMVRGEPRPNQFTADRILNNNRFVATDIDDPAKVSKFKPIWESVFPGVPFTKEILVAIIQGTNLPELENVAYTQLRGFLPDDPLRYETTYMGQTYRHPYTLSFCKIPEGWWGPTIEFNEAGEASGPSVVHIGNFNNYFALKEEEVNLEEEIQYQRQLIEAGLVGAEAFAASELQNEMVDTTKEYFQNRQETLEERKDSGESSSSSDDTSWFFRREPVNRPISKFTLFGAGPGQITDVTNTYSADHFTSLDGLSTKNVRQYHFNDLFVLEGANGGTLVTMPSDPKSSVPVKLTNEANFGNSSRGALMARATGLGNPMKYSTENKQDNINLGNISAKNIAPLGSPLDELIGFEVGTVKKTAKDIAGGALLILGGVIAVRGIITISELSTARNRAKKTKYEAKKAKRDYLESISNTRRTLKDRVRESLESISNTRRTPR